MKVGLSPHGEYTAQTLSGSIDRGFLLDDDIPVMKCSPAMPGIKAVNFMDSVFVSVRPRSIPCLLMMWPGLYFEESDILGLMIAVIWTWSSGFLSGVPFDCPSLQRPNPIPMVLIPFGSIAQ